MASAVKVERASKKRNVVLESVPGDNVVNDKAGKTKVVENVFYLNELVAKRKNETENRKNIEMNKVNKKCEIVEAKDKKYIEALKDELLKKYKAEQEKSQRKIENLKRKAIYKIEEQIKKEERQIEMMCKGEVLGAISRMANKIGWFQMAVLLYKSHPEIFDKKN